MKVNFLSVDLEDWHTSAYLRKYVNKTNYSSRIEFSVEKILELFNRKNVKATFFTLGSVAENYPALIKEIHSEGHEIASHGYSHTPIWDLNPENFQKELVKTNRILNQITGEKIIGFRAAYASLNEGTSWFLEKLQDEGILYDSSIFPLKTPLYGVKNAPLGIYKISEDNILENNNKHGIVEIPFSVYKFSNLKIPCTGGIYGRFLPEKALIFLLKRIEIKRPINFYFHPWEIDKDIPKIKVPYYNKLVSYYGINTYLNKIEKVLDNFKFNSFKNIIESEVTV